MYVEIELLLIIPLVFVWGILLQCSPSVSYIIVSGQVVSNKHC